MAKTGIENEEHKGIQDRSQDSWQTKERLATAHRVIIVLRKQLQDQKELTRLREKEALSIKLTVEELNSKLERAYEEVDRVLENSERQIDKNTQEHVQELERKSQEIEELKARHRDTVLEMTTGARYTLEDLEAQLEQVKARENNYQLKIEDLEELKKKQDKHIVQWNRVSAKMCAELSEVKRKLQSSVYANGKLKDEIALWKKYCSKAEEEKKSIRREIDLEKKVINKFNQFDSYMKTEKQQRYMLLDLLNSFGNQIVNDIKQLNPSKTVEMKTVESQTDVSLDEEKMKQETEKDALIASMKDREIEIEESLKKTQFHISNITQQNDTLREVIKAMKKERENWDKEKRDMEENAKVTKLEESVRILKSNMMNEGNDICMVSALKNVKKEVANLKNLNIHKETKEENESHNNPFHNPRLGLMFRSTHLKKTFHSQNCGL